ncbi:hypothetical protein BH18ACT12_BH18ACT12_02540 [soil metagenome]
MSAAASLPAEATGLLYERHHQRIFGFCLSQLGSREDAEDAVQTTFINAQRGLRRGVVPEFEVAWLFTIARNVCHNTRESASRRGRVEAVRDIEALQDVVALPERGGDVSSAELMQALGALPERQRHALLLRELQGLSYYEIAKELAVSVAAVETLTFRARRSVAEQLGRKQTRGLLAWMLALVRWPFQSGAVPLKLAAVTTTIATTATLAVVPAMREPARAPAPIATQADTPRGEVGTPRTSLQPTRRPKARPTAAQTVAPAAAAPQATPPVQGDAPTAPTPALPAHGDVSSSVASPTMTSLSLDPITTRDVSAAIPEITLPQVELPAVQVPAVHVPVIQHPPAPGVPGLP